MANQKYPPRGDEELMDAGRQARDNMPSDPKTIGLDATDVARLNDGINTAETDLEEHKTAQQAARTKRIKKDGSMDNLADILSELNSRTQKHPGMTDAVKTAMGFPIYDTTKTDSVASDELPVVKIDTAMPLRHTMRFHGENSKGKPDGMRSMGIWVKIGGDATGKVEDYQFQAEDSEPPYIKDFAPEDAGKQAHYLFCWISTAGERGPWLMLSATITSQSQTDNG